MTKHSQYIRRLIETDKGRQLEEILWAADETDERFLQAQGYERPQPLDDADRAAIESYLEDH